MSQKLLITGAGGQLGRDLAELVPDAVALDRAALDVTDRVAVRSAIAAHRPDTIVHAAAMTAVDRCESETDEAFAANALACRWIVEAADSVGARVVAVSTDYVFSGEPDGPDRPWHEWDPTAPASVYGRSKLAGEHELRPCDAVVRSAWLAGAKGENIVKTVLRLAAKGTPMTFVDDQTGSPTFTTDLAATLLALVDLGVTGVVHGVNQGSATWFEWVRAVLEAGGHEPGLVSPISSEDLRPARPARRPRYSVLDDVVLRSLDLAMADHRDRLPELIDGFLDG